MNNNPSPSFTFLPPNPNPNPFYHHHHQQPPFPTAVPPPPDLPTTLSTLKHLIHLSQTTIQSITSLLHTKPTTTTLSTCPFNHHHRLPPSSFFHHYLHCPSSPSPIPITLLQSLNYPTSFQSSQHLISQNKPFTQTLTNSDINSDLCFSLDEYSTSLPSNFFYRDCPGVVTFPNDLDNVNASKMLILPAVLSYECANFGTGNVDVCTDYVGKLLPSEVWKVRNEIRDWKECPIRYSVGVIRLILASYMSLRCDMKDWLVMNSTQYGIVIDMAMSEHICLLFRVCVKAIVREAIGILKLVSRGEENGCKGIECPVLVRVFCWLGYQLSVLYGESNGRLFAIDMLKQWLLLASSSSVMFFDERKDLVCPGIGLVDDKCKEQHEESNSKQEEKAWVIFVSQITAAVAALHERASLETIIKAIHYKRPLNNYQRAAEHGFESQKADELRQKRSNYRPLLEHDGILSQRARDKETNRMKSREELLAEERDYKRRRTSYRGKKIKRNLTHVMRDIIEEYMDEIKQAGGIGCLMKGTGETGMHSSEPFALHSTSDNQAKMSATTISEVHNERLQGRKQLDSDYSVLTRVKDMSPERNMLQRRDSYSNKGHLEPYSGDRNRRDRSHYRNDHGDRSNSGTSEKLVDQGVRDGNEAHRKYPSSPERGHSRSRERSHHNNRIQKTVELEDSYERNAHRKSRSDSVVRHKFEDRYERNAHNNRAHKTVALKDSYEKNAHRKDRSDSVVRHEFEDRYDPFES